VKIQNKPGRYWNNAKNVVVAVTDLRARAGTFVTPWSAKSDPLFTLPPWTPITETLAHLLDERAVELATIAKMQGKRILVWWSGGIDSTLVLSSFIKNLSASDLEIVTVLLSSESIGEHPEFYKNFIHNRIHCMPYLDFRLNNSTLNEYIVLTGDPADCLFGPSTGMYRHLMADGRHLLPFNDNRKLIANAIELRNLALIKSENIEGFGNWYVDKISDNILEVAPPDVTSIADWWWWHYYNFKWEFSVWRPMLRRKCNGDEFDPIEDCNLQSFAEYTYFNTAKFQQWSHTNLKTLIGNDIAAHKKAARDYIFELDRNQVYYDTKIKRESVPLYDNSKGRKLRRPILWDKHWVGYFDFHHKELKAECIDRLEHYKG
jgi:hypothetical protein